MKVDVIVGMVLDFQKRNILTAKQLAQKYDVCERTVYRYIDMLSISLPIMVIHGRRGGYKLVEK
jgi:predicted DNA-binding transcriptional regulator YafY